MSPAPTARGNVVQITGRGGPTTLHAWRANVQSTPVKPSSPPLSVYRNRPPEQRAAFDDARKAYHRGLADIKTRQMRDAHAQINSRLEGSDGCAVTTRMGLIINGSPCIGKSTTVLCWGKTYELAERARLGVTWDARTSEGWTFAPVAYVILGVNDGPKGLCQKLMRFYDQPYKERWDQGELSHRLQEITAGCRTNVLIVDQLQNLRMRHASARQTAEHLKELMDMLPLTVIGAGVNMLDTGLFDDTSAARANAISQISGRFGLCDMPLNEIETQQGRDDWDSLLATIGDRLVLLSKRDGDLPDLADYLYRRTGGITGELMDLLRRGANTAVGGPERISRSLLDKVTLSQRASTPTPFQTSAQKDVTAARIGRAARTINRQAS